MKLIFTTLAVFILAAACSTGPKVETPGELYADILIKKDVLPPTLEISFYSKTRQEGNSMEYTKTVIAVGEPRLNDAPLEPLVTEPGKASFTAGTGGVKAINTISAKVNGKQFEGKTPIELVQTNKMTTVTMASK